MSIVTASQTAGLKKPRMRHMDIAKGIGMICIIAGHLGKPEIDNVVFSFHVPLFFIISGWFFRSASSTREAAIKYAKHLLVPYIYCMVACVLGTGVMHTLISGPEGSWEAMAQSFVSALYGSGSLSSPIWGIPSFGATWFLLALFWALIMLNGIAKQKWTPLVVVGTFLASIATRDWWLPFSLQSGMCALLFVYIGYIAKDKLGDGVLRGATVPHWLAATAVCVWALAYFLDRGEMSIARCYFTCIPVDCIGAVAGTLVVIWLSSLFEHVPVLSSALELLGRYSLTAMCLHLFELKTVPWEELLRFFGFAGDAAYPWRLCLLLIAIKLLWVYLGIGVVEAINAHNHRQAAAA